jgi:hypothetical protein
VDPDARARLDKTMTQIAEQTGATLHVYHQPGRAARRVVLRDIHNDRSTRSARPLTSTPTQHCA